ncbi:permease prefix domain 1-containing protein [bacterium]|nr:permease prefix domain 1-containing protein [bacterium]
MHFLTRVEKLLDIPSAEKNLVMRELKSHYFDLRDELVASGMSTAEAADEAEKRLGSPEDVAARFAPVHNSATWQSALMAAVPFLAWGLLSAVLCSVDKPPHWLVGLLFGSVMLAGSLRELLTGRRPIWLATWLAGAFVMNVPLISLLLRAWKMDIATNGIMSNALQNIPIVVIMLLVLWKMPKWRPVSLILCLMVLCSSVYVAINAPNLHRYDSSNPVQYAFLCIWLGESVLFVLFAMRVFALHDYGNGSQAALFLLTQYTIVFHFVPDHLGIGLVICNSLIVGLIAVLFTRSPSWQIKLISSLIGLFVHYLLVSISFSSIPHSGPSSIQRFAAESMIRTVAAAIPVSTPIILERLKRRRDRIEIAQ